MNKQTNKGHPRDEKANKAQPVNQATKPGDKTKTNKQTRQTTNKQTNTQYNDHEEEHSTKPTKRNERHK